MKPNTIRSIVTLAAAFAAILGSPAASADQGVTKDEIVVGSIQDLSGPLAGYGKQVRNGMQMRVDEVNRAGGIHGRKLRLVIEDSGYDPKKGLLATQKLVQQDGIFAMLGTMGTAIALAGMPIQFEKNVPQIFPLTAARQMYEPLHKLKFATFVTWYDQFRTGVRWMARERGARKFCVLYQDDDAGMEIFKGAEEGLKDIGQDFAEKATYKRGATDFSAQVARMKSSGCDTVVLGTFIRETIGAINEARKNDWNPQFIGGTNIYSELIHKLGGKGMDGLYALHATAVPYPDDASVVVSNWAGSYRTRFNEDPGLFAAYGYILADLFFQAAVKAGAELTVDKLTRTLESTTFERDTFGSPEIKFTPTQHLGSNKSRLSQIQNGKWKVITDYFD